MYKNIPRLNGNPPEIQPPKQIYGYFLGYPLGSLTCTDDVNGPGSHKGSGVVNCWLLLNIPCT